MSTSSVRRLVAYLAFAYAITWGGIFALVARRGFDLAHIAVGRPVTSEMGVAR